eukprot:TRINITY_DN13074_c0_g1_i1.p1 TRINITY_DN13074_c0_g1~~TRINITY_DN13074_c0_g1_i1.p1  ORF type:complete len:221 (+),score=-16.62 TRINITY_DN13074_c0_g1_i1:562-1224(+)
MYISTLKFFNIDFLQYNPAHTLHLVLTLKKNNIKIFSISQYQHFQDLKKLVNKNSTKNYFCLKKQIYYRQYNPNYTTIWLQQIYTQKTMQQTCLSKLACNKKSKQTFSTFQRHYTASVSNVLLVQVFDFFAHSKLKQCQYWYENIRKIQFAMIFYNCFILFQLKNIFAYNQHKRVVSRDNFQQKCVNSKDNFQEKCVNSRQKSRLRTERWKPCRPSQEQT